MKPKFLFNQGHCSFDEIHVRISSSAAMQFYKITKTLYFLELKKTIYNYCLSARYMISCNIYNTPSIIMKVKVLVPQSCPTLCNPMDCSHQAPLSMVFSRQEYWSGVPFPSPGDLPNSGIEPVRLALAGGFFTADPLGKPLSLSRRV